MTREQIIENRRKWAAALRSDTYTQCEGTLFNGESYCCLGVAAHAALGRKIDKVDRPAEHHPHYGAVRDAMGLGTWGDEQFIDANDSQHMSFVRIADMVDALPEPA